MKNNNKKVGEGKLSNCNLFMHVETSEDKIRKCILTTPRFLRLLRFWEDCHYWDYESDLV